MHRRGPVGRVRGVGVAALRLHVARVLDDAAARRVRLVLHVQQPRRPPAQAGQRARRTRPRDRPFPQRHRASLPLRGRGAPVFRRVWPLAS